MGLLVDPNVVYLLIAIVIVFSAWMLYEHHRIDASKTTAYLVPGGDTTMHEWMMGSVENTNGKMITVYTCSRCPVPHHERRERG